MLSCDYFTSFCFVPLSRSLEGLLPVFRYFPFVSGHIDGMSVMLSGAGGGFSVAPFPITLLLFLGIANPFEVSFLITPAGIPYL